MRNRLLALGAAVGLGILVALPGVATATASQSRVSSTALSATASKTLVTAKTLSAKPAPDPYGTPVTVTGPRMCKCTVITNAAGNSELVNTSYDKYRSTVTVSQTTNLTHQTVQVAWTGFTPSAPHDDDTNATTVYDPTSTLYPVMVVECEGYHPANLNDCYGTNDGGVDNPPPWPYQNDPAFAVTTSHGTGSTDVQILTTLQVQGATPDGLYCDTTHPCSLVVVPGQGGVSNEDCSHAIDADDDSVGSITGPTAVGSADFTILANTVPNPWLCSWDKKIVIPLHFAPATDDCPHVTPDFTAEGSPMLAATMAQWQTGICTGANSVQVSYNGTDNEEEARDDFQSGITDVAFTTLPLTGSAPHPFTYAPVAVSAVSEAYYVDNANTGLPYTTIKLTPLLLAKQLTTSYDYDGWACKEPKSDPYGGTPPSQWNSKQCDNAVNGTIPESIFEDPDFLKYNPGSWDLEVLQNDSGAFDSPDIVGGDSDMTWVMTSWVAADKEAEAFLNGKASGGVNLNSDYRGVQYPVSQISAADPFPEMQSQFQQEFPLYTVVGDLVNGVEQGVEWEPEDNTIGPPSFDYETSWTSNNPPGTRDLWAIVDEADAELNVFPVAYLKNAAGKFVQPTVPAMLAAVKDMTAGSDGLLSMNFAKKDPAAYPLTMVIYAVVPTGGISKAKAAAIARFLDYVATRGQQPGSAPGDLAAGYAPLPQSLRQQTLAAAYDVLHQTGDTKKTSAPPATSSPTSSPSPSPSPSKSKSASSSPTPKASTSSTPTARSIAVSFSSPAGAGMSWVVFALILAGGVLLVTGPAALIAGSPKARAAISSRVRRISLLGSGSRGPWRGAPRTHWRRHS